MDSASFSEKNGIQNEARIALAVLIGITALAFLVRMLAHWLEPGLSSDGIMYIRTAEEWYRSTSPDAVFLNRPPLLVYLMSRLMKLGLDAVTAGLAINLFCGTLLPCQIYLISRKIFTNSRIAMAAALLAALHPTAIEFSNSVLRESLYLFLTGSGIIFFLHLPGIVSEPASVPGAENRKTILYSILAGAVTGINFLCRYETLAAIPLMIACLLWQKKIPVRRKFLACGLILLSAASFFILFLLLFGCAWKAQAIYHQVIALFGNIREK